MGCKKAALEESMELINERIEEAKQNVANNLVSPIVYFMELNKMDVQVLAAYVDMWQWSVKDIQNPELSKNSAILPSKNMQMHLRFR